VDVADDGYVDLQLPVHLLDHASHEAQELVVMLLMAVFHDLAGGDVQRRYSVVVP
jgi:hypothetical protein